MSELVDLLLHPVRLRVVQALLGRELTVGQLRERLPEVPQATLYRHLERLRQGEVVEVVAERPVRGAVERTLTVRAERASLGAADLTDVTPDEHRAYFATFVATLLDDFDKVLDTPDVDLAAEGVSYRQVPLWLSDAELGDTLAAVREVLAARLDHGPSAGRRKRVVTIVTLPDPTERVVG